MSTRQLLPLRPAVIIVVLTFLAVAAWPTNHSPHVNAQVTCTVPKTVGEMGDSLRPRWADGQQVRVVAYPGHFTPTERAVMNSILNEFEIGGPVACACSLRRHRRGAV